MHGFHYRRRHTLSPQVCRQYIPRVACGAPIGARIGPHRLAGTLPLLRHTPTAAHACPATAALLDAGAGGRRTGRNNPTTLEQLRAQRPLRLGPRTARPAHRRLSTRRRREAAPTLDGAARPALPPPPAVTPHASGAKRETRGRSGRRRPGAVTARGPTRRRRTRASCCRTRPPRSARG